MSKIGVLYIFGIVIPALSLVIMGEYTAAMSVYLGGIFLNTFKREDWK